MKAVELKSNSLMSKLLAQWPHRDLHLNERLSRYLAGGVVERNGFVLLKTEMDSAGNYSPPAHFDETGYECLVNHIHIDPKNPHDTSQLDQGFTFANRLAELLQGSGYQGPFRIILSYGLDDKVCTVRFHRMREGQSWLHESLEAYKREAILVLDC